jgi:hypothetical protein
VRTVPISAPAFPLLEVTDDEIRRAASGVL